MGRTVTKGADGFFHVSGTAEEQYYASEEIAKSVAKNLDKIDEEKAAANRPPAAAPPAK